MSISLRKEAAKVVLTKRQLPIPPAADVALAIDISGSMSHLYNSGVVQEVVERCLALALNFDPDKKLDVWTFTSKHDYVGSCYESHIDGYVEREIVNNNKISKWGGTNYTPVLEDVSKHFFGSGGFFGMFKKKRATPVFLMFITDGDNQDRTAFVKLAHELRDRNIYIQLLCLGDDYFDTAQAVADSEPNVGFGQVEDVRKMTDEQMMEQLITDEFVQWIKLA